MAACMGAPDDVLAMIRSHHERWDGGGYPDGLRGAAIPLGARVLAVADELATADPASGLEEIRQRAGSAFDPDLVQLVSRHTGLLGAAKSGLTRTSFEGAIAEASRHERVSWKLAEVLGTSLSVHETLARFDAALRQALDYGCMMVAAPGETGGATWYLSGDEGLARCSGSEFSVRLEVGGDPVARVEAVRCRGRLFFRSPIGAF